MDDIHFDITVDHIPYEVFATPYKFNFETRFYVRFNGSGQYVFIWDSELQSLAAIGDDIADIPDGLEVVIAEKLLPYAM